jgi:hypothetical protein
MGIERSIRPILERVVKKYVSLITTTRVLQFNCFRMIQREIHMEIQDLNLRTRALIMEIQALIVQIQALIIVSTKKYQPLGFEEGRQYPT